MPSFADNVLPLTPGQSLGSSTLPWNVFASSINLTNSIGLTVTGLNNSGNETVTGNLTVSGTATLTGVATSSNLNGQFFVDGVKYSGCPAAVTAAGTTNGAIVVIPGSGPLINCPATVPENVIIWNYDRTRDWGNQSSATPPFNAVNFGYDDGNVYAMIRQEMTTSHQDANGVTLGFFTLTTLKNATANGSSGADSIAGEVITAGTLSGTFQALQAAEMSIDISSIGGTVTDARGGVFYINTEASSTTAITNATGVKALGCNAINAGNKPTNCTGIEASDQTSKGTGRNYSLISRGRSLLGYSSSAASGGLDAEDNLNVSHSLITIDSSNNTILQAVNSVGLILQDSGGANQLQITNSLGVTPFTKLSPRTAAAVDVGTTSLPFGNLWLGTAATNNFKFQPAATAAARVISMPDPLGAVNMPYAIANGTSTFTTTAVGASACQTTVTTAATGALTTDSIEIAYATAPAAATDSLLVLNMWVTSGNVNFSRCNPTAGSLTPTALVLNWRVIR